MECTICENKCRIPVAGTGKCRMYTNDGDKLTERYPDNYLVIAPSEIESMPMTHFYPGNKFLQLCTIGCNFRCSGCVSWMLTESPELIKSATCKMTPDEIIEKALNEECKGIMFCFNEPAVSFPTFKRIASLARDNNLLAGCATNAYFTERTFKEFLQYIDFINIGIKGCTDKTYVKLGVKSASPVFRNLRLSVEEGVFTEVAAVYVKGYEDEVMETAKYVASISRDIPFQVMRFLPLGGADSHSEPSIREAENLCLKLKIILNYVYLFNSPGTSYLHTNCPECGKVIVRRGFNGPMCSHVTDYRNNGVCECGFKAPFAGSFTKESGAQVLGFFGGYKIIHCLESIQTVLAFLNERDPAVIAFVLQEILKTGFIKGLYERSKTINGYLEIVEHYAALAGRNIEARELRDYIEQYVSLVIDKANNAERPLVYFSLGHPLLAVFGDKFECNLVETAGGRCVNKDINRDEIPGMTIPVQIINGLNPDIIFFNQAAAYPVNDFYDLCIDNGMDVRAVNDKRIYNLYPYSTSGRPDWIPGLMQIANIIHPEIFDFNVKEIANEFYNKFLGINFHSIEYKRSIVHPSSIKENSTMELLKK